MTETPIAVVIDTSVWVSAFLNPAGYPARLIASGKDGRFAVVSSQPMLDELQDVLRRPRIRRIRNLTHEEIDRFVAAVSDIAQLVPISGNFQLCRDPDDDTVLETAARGGAKFVVSRDEDITRDRDLAERLRQHGIEAVTVRRLLELLEIGQ